MSATVDAEAVAALLGGAAMVHIPSALHELAIDHAPSPAPRMDERGVTREYLDHLARVSARAQAEAGCDALVFVPGAREVDELVARISRQVEGTEDRKSTRLNSSHVAISYAVFCLKK